MYKEATKGSRYRSSNVLSILQEIIYFINLLSYYYFIFLYFTIYFIFGVRKGEVVMRYKVYDGPNKIITNKKIKVY